MANLPFSEQLIYPWHHQQSGKSADIISRGGFGNDFLVTVKFELRSELRPGFPRF